MCSCSPGYSCSLVCTATAKSLTMPNILSHYVKLYAEGLSLVPRLPPFFVHQFTFSIIHESGTSTSVYHPECKLKNKKWGRPGNEAERG